MESSDQKPASVSVANEDTKGPGSGTVEPLSVQDTVVSPPLGGGDYYSAWPSDYYTSAIGEPSVEWHPWRRSVEYYQSRQKSFFTSRSVPIYVFALLVTVSGFVIDGVIGAHDYVVLGLFALGVAGFFTAYLWLSAEKNELDSDLEEAKVARERESQQEPLRQDRSEAFQRDIQPTGRRRTRGQVGDDDIVNGLTRAQFDGLVKLNQDNLSKYYDLVKRHTDKSFSVSVAVGIVGFVLIGVGLGIGFVREDSATATVSYVATGAGIVTEFISGVFFFLYNRTTRQLKDYHDSLLDVQNIMISFSMVSSLNDVGSKTMALSKLLDKITTRGQPSTQSREPLTEYPRQSVQVYNPSEALPVVTAPRQQPTATKRARVRSSRSLPRRTSLPKNGRSNVPA